MELWRSCLSVGVPAAGSRTRRDYEQQEPLHPLAGLSGVLPLAGAGGHSSRSVQRPLQARQHGPSLWQYPSLVPNGPGFGQSIRRTRSQSLDTGHGAHGRRSRMRRSASLRRTASLSRWWTGVKHHYGVAHYLFHPHHVFRPGVPTAMADVVGYAREQGLPWLDCAADKRLGAQPPLGDVRRRERIRSQTPRRPLLLMRPRSSC